MTGQGTNILNFLQYLIVCLPLLGVGLYIFALTTPYKEMTLMTSGADENGRCAAEAAAHDLGGKVLGLAIVLASAVFHSVNLIDLAIWGTIGIASQVAVFYLFELFTPFRVVQEIPKGNLSVGIFSSRISVATGLLIAALISY